MQKYIGLTNKIVMYMNQLMQLSYTQQFEYIQ